MQTGKPPSTTRNGREKKLSPASSAITITVPSLDAREWTVLTVDFPTGLAMIGGAVQIVAPRDVGLNICDAVVSAQDRIRFSVSNFGGAATPEKTLEVQFHPWVRRRSLMPEITFDDLEALTK